MRVLYVLPGIQHPTMRGALRHYHFLQAVAARHETTLLALAKEEVTAEAGTWARQTVHRVRLVRVRAGAGDDGSPSPGSLPWLLWRTGKALRLRAARSRMRRIFREEAVPGRHDAVVFHGKELFSVVEGFRDLPLVADLCDATSLRLRGHIPHARGLERPWAVLAWLRALRADRKLVRQTRHRIFIAARDRDALLSSDGGDPGARIIPNGIDLSYWEPGRKPRHPARITLTGVMDYPSNEDGALWLLQEILPRVRREVPEAEVVIAGRSPTRRLREAARAVRGAEVTGFVEDMRPYLARTTVFAASLRFASGLQNKVLEAMAMEAPVVATPPVAEGVRVQDAAPPPIRVAGDADAFARTLVELLRNANAREELARRARRYVERHFDWSRAAHRFERTLAEAAEPAKTAKGAEAAKAAEAAEAAQATEGDEAAEADDAARSAAAEGDDRHPPKERVG